MKIIHQRKKCIGCGACVSVCPKIFKMSSDGRAIFINDKIVYGKEEEGILRLEEEAACAEEAARICPVRCIGIIK
jgi:ferredoxin